jgi:hypothetical protein
MPGLHMFGTVDHELEEDNPVETKYRQLKRDQLRGQLDETLKPNKVAFSPRPFRRVFFCLVFFTASLLPRYFHSVIFTASFSPPHVHRRLVFKFPCPFHKEEKERINRIIKSPANELTHEERDFLWKFRYSLTDNKKAITKFLMSVDWSSDLESKQVRLYVFVVYVEFSSF